MAYPTITYNQTTGSNTAPSDAVATSGGTSTTVSGTSGTNTITFSSAVDLTGVANDGGSDYIWVNNAGNDRSLYQITAFTGGVSTCTAVTVFETVDGVGVSAVDWHVNGTRNDIQSDNDGYDWMPGWTILLDGDQTRTSGHLRITDNLNVSGYTVTVNDPPLTIKAAATGRAKIEQTAASGNAQILRLTRHCFVQIERIDFSTPNNVSSQVEFAVDTGNISMYDCSISAPNSTASSLFSMGSGDSLSMVKCYIEGGTTYAVDATGNDITMINCWVDCKDSHGTTAALNLKPAYTATLHNVAVTESAGDGVHINREGNAGRHTDWMIRNCTIADCAGDGLEVTGTSNANATPSWNMYIINSLFASNGGWGVNSGGNNVDAAGFVGFNAFYSNTSGEYSDSSITKGDDVTLTADPFTNAGDDNYTINDAAGGGAALKTAGLNAMPDRP